jgi:protocatechuate 3,4-dioxygenase beta subunit
MNVFRISFLILYAGAVVLGQGAGSSIEGIVVEQGTNNTLARVTLDLRALDNPEVRYPGLTTAEGKFSFRSVLPGRYSLMAARVGYLHGQYGQRGPNGVPAVLEIRAGQNVRDIRLSMIPNAAISGRVYDDKGEPAVNAQMHAWRISYGEGWRKPVPVTSVVTNDLGEYRLFGLPPGQYYVSAQPDPRSFVRSPAYVSLAPPLPGMVVMSNNTGGSGGSADPANMLLAGADFAPIYYGGAANEFAATPITLHAGDDLRGMDIPLRRVPMTPLTGTILDSLTREPVRATVTVTPLAPNVSVTSLTTINVTGGVLSVTASRPTMSTGQFRTEPLPQGSYLITAIADLQGRRLAGQAIADSRNPDPSGVRITVAPAFEITGQIVFQGMTAAPNLKIGLMNITSQSLDVAAVPVASDGSFVLRGVPPGRYRVQLSLSTGYVKSIRIAGSDALSDGLQLDRQPEGRIDILVSNDSGKVNGAVTTIDQQPLPGVIAVLVPDQRQRFDLYQSTMADARGQYRFENVPPGGYKLFAWEDVEKNAWLDPAFLNLYEDRGAAVALEGLGVRTATLTAIPPR